MYYLQMIIMKTRGFWKKLITFMVSQDTNVLHLGENM